MKRKFTETSPKSDIARAVPSPAGPAPAIILGGLSTLRGRAGADLLTGVHFDATPSCVCLTAATLA